MRRFKKRPVVIEAMQLTDEVFQARHPSDLLIKGVLYDPLKRTATIKTLEGDMTAQLGDWIIRGVQGELYPCKDAIFWKTYEEIVDA